MQNQRFVWLVKVIFNFTLLIFFCVSWQCSGQNPPGKKGDLVIAKDTLQQQSHRSKPQSNSSKITLDWNEKTNDHFYTFYDKDGKELQRMTPQQLVESSEFTNLPFPKTFTDSQLSGYDLRKLTPEQRTSSLKVLNLRSFSPDKLSKTHWITYGAGSEIQYDSNLSGMYLITRSDLTGVDSTSETPSFSKSVIKILDSYGKLVAHVEENYVIEAIRLSDDARFLFMGVEDIHLDKTESYATRKASLLYDLKEKKQYWLSVKFDINSVIGDADLRFQKGRYFGFSLGSQYSLRLHVLVDPYDHVIYTKEYPAEDHSDFSNPDMGTYSRKTFK